MKKWYAIYTNYRHEKKVAELLHLQEIEYFLPLHKVSKKWSDRIKLVEEPLFKSYIFINICENEITKIRETKGVLNFVYWQKKPAIVRDEEIEIIKKFIGEYINLKVKNTKPKINDKIQIDSGPLMSHIGKVVKVGKSKVKVILESLGLTIFAEIPLDKLVTLPEKYLIK